MFSTIPDLIKFFSSSELEQEELLIRKKFIDLIFKTNVLKMKRNAIVQKYDMYSDARLAQVYYNFGKQYCNLIDSEGLSNDEIETQEDDFSKQIEELDSFGHYSTSYPILSEHVKFAEKFINAVNIAKLKSWDDSNVQGLFRDIDKLLAEYASSLSDFFDENLYGKYRTSFWSETMSKNTWVATSMTEFKTFGDYVINPEFAQLLKQMIDIASSPDIPDVVAKYMLNPTIGSYGVYQNAPTGYPIYVSVFPSHFLLKFAQEIWELRFTSQGNTPIYPVTIPDLHQSRCERLFGDKLRNMSLHSAIKEKVDRLNKDEDDDAGDAGMSSTSTGGPKPPSKRGKSQQDAPQGASQSNSSNVPDDSAYEPDPMLARYARDLTDAVKSQDPSDMNHDHMTRFKSTDYAPRPVGRGSIMRGDPSNFDFTVKVRVRGNDSEYLVTFTRTLKKPIFNPIA